MAPHRRARRHADRSDDRADRRGDPRRARRRRSLRARSTRPSWRAPLTTPTAIKTAIDNFAHRFTSFTPFTTTGLAGGATVEMLVSDGDIPRTAIGGERIWDDPVNPAAAPPRWTFLERASRHEHAWRAPARTRYRRRRPGAAPTSARPIDPDPWGNRYAVNVLHLRTTTTNDVFVLSAGPDEEINTAFTVNGATPGDDDIIAVVRRDPGRTVP